MLFGDLQGQGVIRNRPQDTRLCKGGSAQVEEIVLDNGLNILFHRMPNTHSVAIGLYIKAGSGYESEEQNGITHFLEHLHFRRLGEIGQEELYYRLESMGTSLRGVTYSDFLEFSMKIAPDHIKESLFIFKNLIDADNWTDEEFSKEKQVVINQIKEKESFLFVEDEMRKVVFRNSLLSRRIIGTIENVQHFQKQDIQNYKKQIMNAQNIIFCITGNVDSDN